MVVRKLRLYLYIVQLCTLLVQICDHGKIVTLILQDLQLVKFLQIFLLNQKLLEHLFCQHQVQSLHVLAIFHYPLTNRMIRFVNLKDLEPQVVL